MARIRKDKARQLVKGYFLASLETYRDRLNDTGFPQHSLNALNEEMHVHAEAIKLGSTEVSDAYLDDAITRIRDLSGLAATDWNENQSLLIAEIRKARRDQIRALLADAESLESYVYEEARPSHEQPLQSAVSTRYATLREAVEDFIAEQTRQLPEKTTKQYAAYLDVLLKFFGENRSLAQISKHDASEVKKLLQDLPANRATIPALQGRSLTELSRMDGYAKLSAKTINCHIDTFRRFFEWAELHGKVACPLKSGPP